MLLANYLHERTYVAVLQLLILDAGNNNITGTLPSSWSTLTQASTTQRYLCIYVIPALSCVRLHVHLALQSGDEEICHS